MTSKSVSFSTHRIMLSRVFAVVVLAYVFTAGPMQIFPKGVLFTSEIVGYIGLATAALGRIWCLLFIAGRKNRILTTEGPYSTCRNPLYVFSFLGAIGFGLAVEKPLLAMVIAIFFAVFYPSVVRGEEKHLRSLYGEAFDAYCARVPRWFPKFSLYQEPEIVEVDPVRFRKGILDAMWFLWAFLLWEVIEGLHEFGIIPILF